MIGSDYGLCERALDKMQMYRWLSGHGYACAKSYVDKEAFLEDYKQGLIAFPVYVKPVRGSASIGISQVRDLTTLDLLFEHYDGLMIQEFLRGQEIGADVYIDMLTHEVVSIFTKKKLLMRAGETDKSVSFKDEKLFAFIRKIVSTLDLYGPNDMDFFYKDGEYYLSEINPRFGGAYLHAYAAGVDFTNLRCYTDSR